MGRQQAGRALRDDVRAPRYVSTRRRLGYRFVGAVSAPEVGAPDCLSPLIEDALEVARRTRADAGLVRLLERMQRRLERPATGRAAAPADRAPRRSRRVSQVLPK